MESYSTHTYPTLTPLRIGERETDVCTRGAKNVGSRKRKPHITATHIPKSIDDNDGHCGWIVHFTFGYVFL